MKKTAKNSKIKKFFYANHKRNLKASIAILSCFIVLFFISAMIYANNVLNRINFDDGFAGNADAVFGDDLEADRNYENMYDVTDAEDLKAMLKSWATNNGEKMTTRNVINVLLIGEDNDDGSHRSDSMILVSLNKKTKKIILTSFLRDSYTYMDINGSERYDKTNHSYAWGGASALIETLENNYKIKIDHYVTVNFSSFTKAINAVGGVDVPVTEKEAKFMNDTTHFDDFESGDSVHLDGAHALIFARIRHLDSEASRTDRQKLVIKALITKAKSCSVSQLNSLADQLLPYITTDYSKREIITLGTQALTKGWTDYPITSQTMPGEDIRKEAMLKTWSYNNLMVWIVDYPIAAQQLQRSIYNTTNIQIDEATHQSALDMLVEATSSYYNYNYETTTYAYNRYGHRRYDSGYNYGYDYNYGETTTRRQFNWSLPSSGNDDPGSDESSGIFGGESSVTVTLPDISDIIPQITTQ